MVSTYRSCSQDLFGKRNPTLSDNKPIQDPPEITRGGNPPLATNLVYEFGQICYPFRFENQVHLYQVRNPESKYLGSRLMKSNKPEA